jgi:hypothetical protein
LLGYIISRHRYYYLIATARVKGRDYRKKHRILTIRANVSGELYLHENEAATNTGAAEICCKANLVLLAGR